MFSVKLLLERRTAPPAPDGFLREATVAATPDHAGIVRVHADGDPGVGPCG